KAEAQAVTKKDIEGLKKDIESSLKKELDLNKQEIERLLKMYALGISEDIIRFGTESKIIEEFLIKIFQKIDSLRDKKDADEIKTIVEDIIKVKQDELEKEHYLKNKFKTTEEFGVSEKYKSLYEGKSNTDMIYLFDRVNEGDVVAGLKARYLIFNLKIDFLDELDKLLDNLKISLNDNPDAVEDFFKNLDELIEKNEKHLPQLFTKSNFWKKIKDIIKLPKGAQGIKTRIGKKWPDELLFNELEVVENEFHKMYDELSKYNGESHDLQRLKTITKYLKNIEIELNKVEAITKTFSRYDRPHIPNAVNIIKAIFNLTKLLKEKIEYSNNYISQAITALDGIQQTNPTYKDVYHKCMLLIFGDEDKDSIIREIFTPSSSDLSKFSKYVNLKQLGITKIEGDTKIDSYKYGNYNISGDSFSYGNKFGKEAWDIPVSILFQKLLYAYFINFVRVGVIYYVTEEYSKDVTAKNASQTQQAYQRKYIKLAILLHMSADYLIRNTATIARIKNGNIYGLSDTEEKKLRGDLNSEYHS
ncbi:MAG: hypothetical protein PHI86_06435, partial [Candidatus Omnitrophica bacterium]|nr:hypothetical protein [Candidatus Omnitrophota bacterium]